MPDNDDILDGTVDEVKQKIDDAVDLDFKSLLQSEEEGKDRKTVKEYIEQKIGEEVDEEMHSESSDDITEDEVLEEIEDETSGGILGGYSRNSVFAGGLLLGLLIGLVAMGLSGAGMGADEISKQDAREKVTQIMTGQEAQISETFGEDHGLYTFNVTVTGQRGNETVTNTQRFYMTKDGEEIIRRSMLGRSTVIPVDRAIEAAQQQNSQPPANESTGNETNSTQ